VKDTSSKISIVVPFRNINDLSQKGDDEFVAFLLSLKEVSQSVEEVILVNDHSVEGAMDRIEEFKQANWKLLALGADVFGKKAALRLGIEEAKTEYIWTLDADVQIVNFRKEKFNSFLFELKEDLVILPVFMRSENSLLGILQSNEWRYLQFMTRLSAKAKLPMMCNGANLIFKRSVFLDKIEKHQSVSSGDDMFLMSEVLKEKGSVSLSWEVFCSVEIFPVNTWKQALHQRIRWAGKTTQLPFTKSTVLHMAFALLSAMHVLAFFGIFELSLHLVCAKFLILKVFVEIVGMQYVFGNRMRANEIVLAISQMLLYPFFSLLIFISSLFFVPKWKERRVSLK
jgi:glycosyltransferase involved in cell wall biosynthesis